MQKIPINSRQHTEFIDITVPVQQALKDLKFRTGTVTVFIPHTTAGVTIPDTWLYVL